MTARCVIAGHIAPRSQPARITVRGVPVAPTRTPIVDLDPCPCGKPNCDRDEWAEMMNDVCEVCGGVVCDCVTPQARAAMLARISADPHDYNDLTKLDIPY